MGHVARARDADRLRAVIERDAPTAVGVDIEIPGGQVAPLGVDDATLIDAKAGACELQFVLDVPVAAMVSPSVTTHPCSCTPRASTTRALRMAKGRGSRIREFVTDCAVVMWFAFMMTSCLDCRWGSDALPLGLVFVGVAVVVLVAEP